MSDLEKKGSFPQVPQWLACASAVSGLVALGIVISPEVVYANGQPDNTLDEVIVVDSATPFNPATFQELVASLEATGDYVPSIVNLDLRQLTTYDYVFDGEQSGVTASTRKVGISFDLVTGDVIIDDPENLILSSDLGFDLMTGKITGGITVTSIFPTVDLGGQVTLEPRDSVEMGLTFNTGTNALALTPDSAAIYNTGGMAPIDGVYGENASFSGFSDGPCGKIYGTFYDPYDKDSASQSYYTGLGFDDLVNVSQAPEAHFNLSSTLVINSSCLNPNIVINDGNNEHGDGTGNSDEVINDGSNGDIVTHPGESGYPEDPASVPEPATALGLLALAGVGLASRRGRNT
jgi:hypothetical protein